ncbi:DNA-binding protein [Ralstonia pseudosolanacearum]|uniref:DNA-binding protein n=1 Tax=Ralstonia pseudosolanacearum TaxID=1310165 RepID=UPI003D07463C
MSHANQARPTDTGEPMIDAKEAAAALRLPYYWFADHTMRARYRIPHYLLGALVRYRLSELTAWLANAALQPRETDPTAGMPGEGAQ